MACAVLARHPAFASIRERLGRDLEWPLFGWTDDVRPMLRELADAGQSVALATICHIKGPAPRQVGAQMLFGDKTIVGYFSGGCIEADVALHARDVIANGEPRRLVYGDGSPWFDIRLTCGGRMDILVECIGPDDPVITQLNEAAVARRSIWYATNGYRRQVSYLGCAEADRIGLDGSSQASRYFRPPSRLIIFGADPAALAIAQSASIAGIETIIVRDDGVSSHCPIASIRTVRGTASDTLNMLRPDRWTAVVAATHDIERDHAVLCSALASKAGYIGAFGSISRLPDRLARLSAGGFDGSALSRLRAPVGRKATGTTPFAIASGVVAEIFEALRDNSG